MKVRWTSPASRDLQRIGDYIAADSPSAAARIVTRITQWAAKLAETPYVGRIGRVHGTRELVITGTPFVLAYQLRAEDVEILAVFHGARK